MKYKSFREFYQVKEDQTQVPQAPPAYGMKPVGYSNPQPQSAQPTGPGSEFYGMSKPEIEAKYGRGAFDLLSQGIHPGTMRSLPQQTPQPAKPRMPTPYKLQGNNAPVQPQAKPAGTMPAPYNVQGGV